MAEKTHEPDAGRVTSRVAQLNPRKHTPEGLQRLRETALKNRPWQYTRGPRTPEGKAKVAQNGKYAQKNAVSRREIAAQVAEFDALATGLAEMRRRIGDLA